MDERTQAVAAASCGFIYVKCNLANRLLQLAVLVVAVASSSLACLNLPRRSYQMIHNEQHTFPELTLSRTELSLVITILPSKFIATFSEKSTTKFIFSMIIYNIYSDLR